MVEEVVGVDIPDVPTASAPVPASGNVEVAKPSEPSTPAPAAATDVASAAVAAPSNPPSVSHQGVKGNSGVTTDNVQPL